MRVSVVIGDKLRLTEEAVELLRAQPERELVVEDIFDDHGVTVVALVLPGPGLTT